MWFVFLDWQAIRTTRRSHSAQFDLMKDVRVKVYTLLSGPCTNGNMIKSTRYTEKVQKPSSTGQSLWFYSCIVKKKVCFGKCKN